MRAGLKFEAVWTGKSFSSAAPTTDDIHDSSVSTEMSLIVAQGCSSGQHLVPAFTVLRQSILRYIREKPSEQWIHSSVCTALQERLKQHKPVKYRSSAPTQENSRVLSSRTTIAVFT